MCRRGHTLLQALVAHAVGAAALSGGRWQSNSPIADWPPGIAPTCPTLHGGRGNAISRISPMAPSQSQRPLSGVRAVVAVALAVLMVTGVCWLKPRQGAAVVAHSSAEPVHQQPAAAGAAALAVQPEAGGAAQPSGGQAAGAASGAAAAKPPALELVQEPRVDIHGKANKFLGAHILRKADLTPYRKCAVAGVAFQHLNDGQVGGRCALRLAAARKRMCGQSELPAPPRQHPRALALPPARRRSTC